MPRFTHRKVIPIGATARVVAQRAPETLTLVRHRTQSTAETIARLSVTAVFAYLVALLLPLPGAAQPILAPLTALLVVQVSLYQTLRSAAHRVAAVVAGVLLAIALADLAGFTWWSLGLTIAAGLAVGSALHLGDAVLEVPVSAMLILSNATRAAAVGRIAETAIGTAAGLRRTARVFSQVADVTCSTDVTSLVEKTEADLGPISILVNNAGMGLFGPAHEKTEAEWDRVLDTNLKSVFLVSRAVAPSMIRRGSGDIINISSLAGRNAFAGGGLYCASKWGLQGLSACMAEDLRDHGIRVSVVCPGSVATEFSGRGPKDPAKVLTADDVAHAVEMIATQGPQSFLSEVQLRPLRKA